MIVYPGINTSDMSEFQSRMALFNGHVDGIHIDVADGEFVKNKNVSLEDIGRLPHGFFEAHLMVEHPQSYVDICAELGFSRVLVAFDAWNESQLDLACELQKWVHELGMEFGLYFKRGVQIPQDDRMNQFDHAMVMTIDLGPNGNPFSPEQLEVVRNLRQQCPLLPIAVDGHVDTITAPEIIKAGATHLVSTSYLTGEDALQRYSLLKGLS